MLSSRCARRLVTSSVHTGKGRPIVQSPARCYSQILNRRSLRSPSTWPSRPLKGPVTAAAAVAPTSHLSLRFASSTSTDPALSSLSTAGSIPYEGVSSEEWDSLLQQAETVEFAPVHEHLGYLKEMGLDFGWGPTAVNQVLLENLHITAGLPWWGAIATATLVLRLFAFPLYIKATDTSARLATVGPAVKDLQAEMQEARVSADTVRMTQLTQNLRAIYAAAGIKLRYVFMPILFQAPLGYGMFRLVRNMCTMPVPGLENAGVLWFSNLAVADPTYLLPLASAGLMYITFKKGGELATVDPAQRGVQKIMTYAFPGIIFVVSAGFPAGIQLLFLSTSVYAWIQMQLFRTPAFREIFNITPLPQTGTPQQPKLNTYVNPEEAANKYTVKSTWNNVKNKVTETMGKRKRNAEKPKRMSKSDMEKAKQYEKDRRAEMEAAREEYVKRQRRQ